MSDITHLGFLGLGNMGAAIALRLIHPGSTLHVFDPNPEAVTPLVEAGAIAHASPRAVADAATVVMACLPSSAVCESVLFGEDGVAAGRTVRTYIEMSTLGPTAVSSNTKATRCLEYRHHRCARQRRPCCGAGRHLVHHAVRQ
ncbi:NAD(P)-binding domain-containing protein [Paraburkholderia sp. MM5482-R1]|uniref:NAD(P)-binding domain-containing protein n=1 Tax=Paraburkholderia sp. MM5482-R1 TaxID=2991063 RepID=UPI003D1DA203